MADQNVECQQCNKVPDNYLCLDCGHSFCLLCMAQNFLKGGRLYQQAGSKGVNYICSICENDTELDNVSVQAIETIIMELLMPQLNQIRGPQEKKEHIIAEEKEQQENSVHILNQSPSAQTPCRNVLESYNDTSTKDQQDNFNQCERHNNEEQNLFCFTCECKCLCVKCIIQQSQHKKHDIQNINISIRKLLSKMNESTHTIQASLELMNLQMKRVSNENQQNLEQIEDFCKQMKQSFQNLMNTIQKKEKDLFQQMEQLKQIQEQQSKKLTNEIQLKINTLLNLKNDFQNISLNKSVQPTISLFNFYSECRQIMQTVLGQINFGELMYLNKNQNNVKYFPDYKGMSVLNIIESENFFNITDFEENLSLIKEAITNLDPKVKLQSSSQLIRSFSMHDKNIANPPQFSQQNSITKRCATQNDEPQQSSIRFKGQAPSKLLDLIQLNIAPIKPTTPSDHSKLRNSSSKNDDIKNYFSERAKNSEEKNLKAIQLTKQTESIKRSISQLASDISPTFKSQQNTLSILRFQQNIFDRSIQKK